MTTHRWLAVLSAIWLSGIALSVIDIRQIHRQRREERHASIPAPADEASRAPDVDEVIVETAEPAPSLVMPSVTIFAQPSGVAEMQGRPGPRPDDLVIGPGIVTHPVAIPRDDATTPPAR